jgi:hypothetical protein
MRPGVAADFEQRYLTPVHEAYNPRKGSTGATNYCFIWGDS